MQATNEDLRRKLEPFFRRWRLMALVVIAITVITYVHYDGQPIEYAATTQIFVRSSGPSPVVGNDPETDPARRLLNEAQILQSPTVAAKVAQLLGSTQTPRELLKQITVTASTDSDFLSLTATTPNPQRSANLANGFASAFAALSAPQPAKAGASVQAVQRALAPGTGAGPSPARNAVFAAILGLVLAGLLVLGLEAFDRRLRSPVVESEYGIALLASIPFSRRAQGATRSGSRLPVAVMEQVRGLRTMLDHAGAPGGAPRTLLVTSAIPGEGKSTLVKSLALAYFESAKSVLVIDADLRQPTLQEFFEAPMVPGLSDVLRSSVPLTHAIQEVQAGDIEPAYEPALTSSQVAGSLSQARDGEGAPSDAVPTRAETMSVRPPVLHLLTSGSGTSDPPALLGSAQLQQLLIEASENYDIVLIDSPPVLAVSDAIPLATAADGVVVVARSDFVTRDAALRCRQALERLPSATVLGLVANAVRDNDEFRRSYYLDR